MLISLSNREKVVHVFSIYININENTQIAEYTCESTELSI